MDDYHLNNSRKSELMHEIDSKFLIWLLPLYKQSAILVLL